MARLLFPLLLGIGLEAVGQEWECAGGHRLQYADAEELVLRRADDQVGFGGT